MAGSSLAGVDVLEMLSSNPVLQEMADLIGTGGTALKEALTILNTEGKHQRSAKEASDAFATLVAFIQKNDAALTDKL
eukprot:2761635-Amphidinium_carterae.1